MKGKEKIYEKGITLIALVITIIILLILAGVTLNLVLNGGIINKSQTAVDKYTEEQAKEKLLLALFEYKMDKVTKKEGTDLQTTLSKLGPVIEAEDTNYYEVEIDGYLFWVHKETLEIISKGPSNPVPPTKIEFSSATAEANIGEGKTFSLKLEPQNANPKFLKWSVNDESLAKIQNGVLTGLKEGTVVVTVTSTEDASITASCTVTIKAIELTGITLNKTSTTIGMGKTEKLEVTYTPTNATYKDITWSTSSAGIATVENGTVKGIKAGTATITVTSVKNSSIKAECSVTVEEIIEISTVEELKTFRNAVNSGTKYIGKKVVLTNDLDLNPGKYTVANDGTVTFSSDAEQWTAIGTETNYFAGTFDGQGHTISGLYINKPSTNFQGLFGYAKGGVVGQSITYIKNIVIKDVNINGGLTTGGIVGNGSIKTMIEKCGVSGGTITTNTVGNYYTHGGGIVARGYVIKECFNTATIKSAGKYQEDLGGIAGQADEISNCYNVGAVYSDNLSIGGIAGEITNNINNCYNTGDLHGRILVGGVVGSFEGGNILKNCYNSGSINASSEGGGIIGKLNSSNANVSSCLYLTGTASTGIGRISKGTATIEASDTLPDLMSVINGDNAFVEDTDNINGSYPILNWQDKE